MIRVLIPRCLFSDARLNLLERTTFKGERLQIKKFKGAKRFDIKNNGDDMFLEALVAGREKFKYIAEKLTDSPIWMQQSQFGDMETWLIDENLANQKILTPEDPPDDNDYTEDPPNPWHYLEI